MMRTVISSALSILRTFLARRDVRKAVVDAGMKGIGFSVALIASLALAADLNPEYAALIAIAAAWGADVGRRWLRDWLRGVPA